MASALGQARVRRLVRGQWLAVVAVAVQGTDEPGLGLVDRDVRLQLVDDAPHDPVQHQELASQTAAKPLSCATTTANVVPQRWSA